MLQLTADAPAERTGVLPRARARMPHLPALDGVRALAVLAVLLFHGGVSWAHGGFLGVDAFFVLSGYLITTLLVLEWRSTGGIGLGGFWARRARRLLPALFAVLLAAGLYAYFVATAESLHSLRMDALATLGYVANWHLIDTKQGYFDAFSLPSPLRHTWSLAIEEQFYLVWPLLLLVVFWLRSSLRLLLGVIVVGALGSAVGMALLFRPASDPSRVYYGTDTRAQSLLVGAALAVSLVLLVDRARAGRPLGRRVAQRAFGVLGLAGGLGTLAAWWLADGSAPTLYRGGFAVAALAVAAVLADVVLVPAGLLSRALSLPPLVFLGRISYGVYLWHWPIFLVTNHERTGLGGARLLAARLALTLAVSVASFYLLERPVLRGRLPAWRALVALPVTAAAVLAAILVSTSPLQHGARLTAAGAGTRAGSAASLLTPLGAPARAAHVPARVMFVGDSVSDSLAVGLEGPAARYGARTYNEGSLGCGVVRGGPYMYFGDIRDELPQCQTWPTHWTDAVAKNDPDVTAMVIGRWEVMDRLRDGRWTRIGDPEYDAYLTTEIELGISILTAKGGRVALCTAPYYRRGEQPDGSLWPEDKLPRVDALNALLRKVAAAHPDNVRLVDLGGRLAPNGRYTSTINGLTVRETGVHVTTDGAAWLAPWLMPQLLALAGVGVLPDVAALPIGTEAAGESAGAGSEETTAAATPQARSSRSPTTSTTYIRTAAPTSAPTHSASTSSAPRTSAATPTPVPSPPRR
ncbi:MAG: acyltransferase [Actinomycetota bacterium]|nr:acyltransferase [Actinomycetota bacterium]